MAAPAPCGTFTAYKRHKRNEETVDDACAQAARDQKNDRKDKSRTESADSVDRSTNDRYNDMTRLDVLQELRRRLFQHMDEAAPQNVSQIASQLRLVAAEIDEISGEPQEKSKSPESVFDEVSQMRSKKAS